MLILTPTSSSTSAHQGEGQSHGLIPRSEPLPRPSPTTTPLRAAAQTNSEPSTGNSVSQSSFFTLSSTLGIASYLLLPFKWDLQTFDKGIVMKTSIIPVGKCKAGCEGAISKWDPCCSNCAVTPTHAISLVTLAILHSDCWLGKQQGETCIHTCSNFENIIVGIWCIMLCCSNAMCALCANPLIWRSIIVRSSRYYPALEKDQSVDPYLTLAPHEPSSGPNMAP